MESAVATAVVVEDVRAEFDYTPRCGRFSSGSEQLPETSSKLRVGRFSDGIEQTPAPAKLRMGRFSTGIEKLPETRSVLRLGSFADGYDRFQRR